MQRSSPLAARRAAVTAVAAALLATVWGAGATRADLAAAREAFKSGVEAMDLGRFDDAVQHLRRAVGAEGRESRERVFLSGVFSRPYLPHFYLGSALYQAGVENCEEVLLAFAESRRQGVVQEFGRLLAELEAARDDCAQRLLPAAGGGPGAS